MSEISENIIFKKDTGGKIEIPQKFVGLKSRQEGILTVNFRTPEEYVEDIKNFFGGLQGSQFVTYDIGDTGEVQCYFKGVAPILQQTDESGFEYYFISVTLQELKKSFDDDELPTCNGC